MPAAPRARLPYAQALVRLHEVVLVIPSRDRCARRRWLLNLGLAFAALLLGLGGASGALADNTVSFSILPGDLSVALTAQDLTPVPYSPTDDNVATGGVTLTIDNATSANTGWSVSIVATDFACSCGFDGATIPASDFAISSLGDPVVLAGEEIDPDGGPIAIGEAVNSDLSRARTILSAQPDSGNGAYSLDIGLALTVPAGSRPATYTSTVTVTVSAAP
jgi:hypothetical protein